METVMDEYLNPPAATDNEIDEQAFYDVYYRRPAYATQFTRPAEQQRYLEKYVLYSN